MPVTITWYGHAAFGIQLGAYHLLLDPYFTGNPTASISAAEAGADYILVTHGHGDHLGDTIAIAQRTGAVVIANAEISRWLAGKNVKTHAQHLGGGHQHPFGYLKLTLALHGSALPDGSYGGNPAGFLLTTPQGKKLYMAGDTGLFGDMRLIGEGGLDLAILPIGDNYTMGPDDAIRAIHLLNPRHVIPMHYNTFSLITQDVLAWAARAEAETSACVHVLDPGGIFQLTD